ncbi:MAG: 50S ribosomal protein L3 [Ignavibacteria bacterium]|nr:50S ribosomal protein L3 [Ignavibacteria bacterium]
MIGLLGKKTGMTRIFDENGNVIPVTIVEAGPCFVTQIKTKDKDGYDAVQLGFDERRLRSTNKPLIGHFNKAGVSPKKFLAEFRDFDLKDLQLGQKISVEIFNEGDKITVQGISKGKGFQGVVKRHGFGGGPVSHGQSDRLRAPGSIGASSFPSRVFKGQRMAGRMGGDKVSIRNLKIVKIDKDQNLIFIKGAIPGHINGYVKLIKK